MEALFTNKIFLFVLAVLPAILLMIYIYRKDRLEKEPISILIKLFIAGIVICFPAGSANVLFETLISAFFGITEDMESISLGKFLAYQIVDKLIVGAGVEESLKLFAVMWLAKPARNKENNSTFDSIVYCVFVSLGFALFENIDYVMEYGFATAVTRFFLSVPGHMFFSIVMGYCVSMWSNFSNVKSVETANAQNNVIKIRQPEYPAKKWLVMSLALPVLCHFVYNFSLTLSDYGLINYFYLLAVIFAVYVTGFIMIHKLSSKDANRAYLVEELLLTKYPELINHRHIAQQSYIEEIQANPEKAEQFIKKMLAKTAPKNAVGVMATAPNPGTMVSATELVKAYKAAHPEVTDAEVIKVPISELYAAYIAAQTKTTPAAEPAAVTARQAPEKPSYSEKKYDNELLFGDYKNLDFGNKNNSVIKSSAYNGTARIFNFNTGKYVNLSDNLPISIGQGQGSTIKGGYAHTHVVIDYDGENVFLTNVALGTQNGENIPTTFVNGKRIMYRSKIVLKNNDKFILKSNTGSITSEMKFYYVCE